MTITEQLRQELCTIIQQAEAGDTAGVVRTAREALVALSSTRLLTTREAADALGVRSINTVKLWCRAGVLASVQRGNRTLIPLFEVERVRRDGPMGAANEASGGGSDMDGRARAR